MGNSLSDTKDLLIPFFGNFDFLRGPELVKCMVRRPTAREKLVDEESLRQCIRPVCGELFSWP
jgi:hypothetical protein